MLLLVLHRALQSAVVFGALAGLHLGQGFSLGLSQRSEGLQRLLHYWVGCIHSGLLEVGVKNPRMAGLCVVCEVFRYF